MLTAAASDPSSTAAWSLGIAVLSLGVSAFSFGWQVLQWRLTGSRVTVETRFGYGVGGSRCGMNSTAPSWAWGSRPSASSRWRCATLAEPPYVSEPHWV